MREQAARQTRARRCTVEPGPHEWREGGGVESAPSEREVRLRLDAFDTPFGDRAGRAGGCRRRSSSRSTTGVLLVVDADLATAALALLAVVVFTGATAPSTGRSPWCAHTWR